MPKETANLIPLHEQIYLIRGRRVMLDFELANLYEVTTSAFNQAVTRHQERLPDDFMFQLERQKFRNLISQSVISSGVHGGRRKETPVRLSAARQRRPSRQIEEKDSLTAKERIDRIDRIDRKTSQVLEN